MPEAAELWGVLLHSERYAHALRDPDVRKAAALKRVRLWEYLRRQAEIRQGRAVRDARDAGAEWGEVAPHYAVTGANGAYQKARRQRAAELSAEEGALPVRRTPEAVAWAEEERAEAERAERRQEREEQQRHLLTVRVAEALLEAREEMCVDEEADYWLGEVEEVLQDCRTPRQYASLAVYVSAALRYLERQDQNKVTPAAARALENARSWQTRRGPGE
ncbi:hypothetical protein ABZ569_33885 [Streptomyces albus]|uniref:hypothetical protein n=1 Tax=Streptomyces albus TaxID=1888 RepID=UPI00340CFEBD